MLFFGCLLASTKAQEFNDHDYVVLTSGWCSNHDLCQDIDTEEECTTAATNGVWYEDETVTGTFADSNIADHQWGCTFHDSIVNLVLWNPVGTVMEAAENQMIICDCTLTPAPTWAPSPSPTKSPTSSPSVSPSPSPTPRPTTPPTESPTNLPTYNPTAMPTTMPTAAPTVAPTTSPTSTPTNPPSPYPTATPTTIPTENPSETPTPLPTTLSPTYIPTRAPSQATVEGCVGISLDINSWMWSGSESVSNASIMALFKGDYAISGTKNDKARWYMYGEKAEFYWSVDQWRLVPKGDYHAAITCGILDSCDVPPVNGDWTIIWNGEDVGLAGFELSCDRTPSPTVLDNSRPTIENCNVLSTTYWMFPIVAEVEWPKVEVTDDEDENVFVTKECTIDGTLVTCGIQVPGPTVVTYTAWDYGFHNTTCDLVIFYLDWDENVFESIGCSEFEIKDVYIFEDYSLAHDYCSRTGDDSLPSCDDYDELESFFAKDGTLTVEYCVYDVHVLLREDVVGDLPIAADSDAMLTLTIAAGIGVIVLCTLYSVLLLRKYLKQRAEPQKFDLGKIRAASFQHVNGSFASEYRSVKDESVASEYRSIHNRSKSPQRQSTIMGQYRMSQAIRRSKKASHCELKQPIVGLRKLSQNNMLLTENPVSDLEGSEPGTMRKETITVQPDKEEKFLSEPGSPEYGEGEIDDTILSACTDIRPEPKSLPPCWSYDKSTDSFVNEVLKRRTKVQPVWFVKHDTVSYSDEVNNIHLPGQVLRFGREASSDDVQIQLIDERVLWVPASIRHRVLKLPWPRYESGDYAEAIEGDKREWVRIVAPAGEIKNMPMYRIFHLGHAKITDRWPASLLFPSIEKWSKAQVSEWLRSQGVTDLIRMVAFHKGLDGKILANSQIEELVDDYGFAKADAETLVMSIASLGSKREYKCSAWSADKVEMWLRAIGMEHYADIFKQNTVTGDRLQALRRADLRDFGITDRDLAKFEVEISKLSRRALVHVN